LVVMNRMSLAIGENALFGHHVPPDLEEE